MKHLIYTFCILSLFACTNNKQEAAQTYSPTPTGLQGIQASNVASAANTQANANSGALNPAHGAPGHRCDIAVGAPLNSPAAQTATAPVTQQVTTQQVTAQQPTTTSATPTVNEKGQKLNPAHGMPGHKCEIAVGAPLDSKPTQNPSPAPQASATTTPVKATTAAATPMFNEKGQRLNPEHGKPGHKCEIAVGAPLT